MLLPEQMKNEIPNIEDLIRNLKIRIEKTKKLYLDLINTYLHDRIKIETYNKVIESIKKRVNFIRTLITENTPKFDERRKLQSMIYREFNAIKLVEHMLVKQIPAESKG